MEELGKDALKERAGQILDENLTNLAEAQELLYADNRYSVLIILQAMDAAGKDGTIKHVMSGINPQGCQVFSFKKPSTGHRRGQWCGGDRRARDRPRVRLPRRLRTRTFRRHAREGWHHAGMGSDRATGRGRRPTPCSAR